MQYIFLALFIVLLLQRQRDFKVQKYSNRQKLTPNHQHIEKPLQAADLDSKYIIKRQRQVRLLNACFNTLLRVDIFTTYYKCGVITTYLINKCRAIGNACTKTLHTVVHVNTHFINTKKYSLTYQTIIVCGRFCEDVHFTYNCKNND